MLQRYADVSYIGLFSLGTYRNQLSPPERNTYYSGMVKFIGRYAATEAPKYTVAKVEWSDQSIRGANGIMVDSKVTLVDGSTYEVRWLLVPYGGSYKVRDAMVVGFWMTPFLKKLFEDYIAQNGGNPRALSPRSTGSGSLQPHRATVYQHHPANWWSSPACARASRGRQLPRSTSAMNCSTS